EGQLRPHKPKRSNGLRDMIPKKLDIKGQYVGFLYGFTNHHQESTYLLLGVHDFMLQIPKLVFFGLLPKDLPVIKLMLIHAISTREIDKVLRIWLTIMRMQQKLWHLARLPFHTNVHTVRKKIIKCRLCTTNFTPLSHLHLFFGVNVSEV
ncbi:hypothetical protein ACJX0J_023779, partial [Zea mays]